MRKKWLYPFYHLHWSAKTVLKTGLYVSNALLLAAFAVSAFEHVLACQMAETSVRLFAETIVAGLFMDVVAKRMGLEDMKKK